MPRGTGTRNLDDEDVNHLLDIISTVLPGSTKQWAEVTRLFNEGRETIAKMDSLKKKFDRLRKTKPGTGTQYRFKDTSN